MLVSTLCSENIELSFLCFDYEAHKVIEFDYGNLLNWQQQYD